MCQYYFSRDIFRSPKLRGLRQLHPAQVRELEQAEGHEGGVHALHVRHRHQQHRLRLRRRHGRHHQEQPQGLRTLLRREEARSRSGARCRWTRAVNISIIFFFSFK